LKAVVIGATGFVGQPLCARLLKAGHTVTALSRSAERARATLGPEVNSLAWGAQAGDAWKLAVAEANVVIHLAGEPVAAQRWTPAFKQQLRASRVGTTRALVEVICQTNPRPSALVCASAVGFYGDRNDEVVTEASPPGSDFLAGLCQAWEAEADKATACGVRVARLRVGVVLGQGGALEKMLAPLPVPISPWRLGLGGPMGSGRQWVPWVHIDDAVGLFFWAATNAQIRGAVNVTAPHPVTNAEFAHAIGRALRRPAFLPLPAFALRILVGEFAETLLGGQRALPDVAQRLGYRFRCTDIDSALRSLLAK
jgi:uncharacterized protein (TIGR01777 family)